MQLHLVALVLIVGMAHAGRAVAQAPSTTPPVSAPQAQAPPAQQPAAAGAPAGNAEDGRKLYISYGCYQCHGYEAQGSSATGPRLGPRVIALATLLKYVRQPTGQMPPYTTKVVSDADLTNIYAFLQSRPAPTPVGNIPLLK